MKKSIVGVGLIGAVLIFGSIMATNHYSTKSAISMQEETMQQVMNVKGIMEFAKLVDDYQTYELNPQYVMVQITKIASPLYEQEETKDIAFSMENASGMIQDGKIDELNAFMKSDFKELLDSYSKKAKSKVDKLL